MRNLLGRPVQEALSSLPAGAEAPRVLETAAPRKDGHTRQEGTLRIVACREGTWIAARFPDRTLEEIKTDDSP